LTTCAIFAGSVLAAIRSSPSNLVLGDLKELEERVNR